jgi:hypothetical protein
MKVVTYQRPSVNAQGIRATKFRQSLKKIFPIIPAAKYLYSINAPAYNMM